MVRFRVYYADGSTWDHKQGLDKMPTHGAISILQGRGYDERLFITSQSPYYIFVRGEWLPAWINDIEDYLSRDIGEIEKFLVGRVIPKAEFITIYEQAKLDRANEALD